MFHPLSEPPDPSISFRARLTEAIRQAWRFWFASWRAVLRGSPVRDVLASITVAAVALPLNVALAVAAGLPPTVGLVAGAVGGGFAAALGGAPLSVSGPTATISILVFGIYKDFGAAGVAAAAILVGFAELAVAFTLAGRLVHRIPEAVLSGFLTGVGLLLLSSQIPEVLGFDYRVSDMAVMMTRPDWLHDVSWLAVAAGLFVAFLVVTTSQFRRFPAAIVGIGLITFAAVYVDLDIKRVGPVPSALPSLTLPFVPAERWLALLARTAPIALLVATESLLSARAVDRMSGGHTKHDSNLEMFGQGVANIATGLFSGMPIAGVIVRSNVNYQSGARTRLSALCHALLLILAVVYLSDFIAQVPLTALAGFLCVIAFRLIEVRTFVHLAQTAWLEAAAFAVTAIGTATDHLFIGLGIGIVFHAIHVFTKKPVRAHERPAHPGVRADIDPEPAPPRVAPRAPARSPWDALARPALRGHATHTSHDHDHAPPGGHATHTSRGQPTHVPANRRHDHAAAIHHTHRRPTTGHPAHRALPAPHADATPAPHPWLDHIRDRPYVPRTAYVHPKASVIGRVVLGDDVHVAADTSLRADEGSPFHIGAGSNVQDGVILHALKDRCVRVGGQPWAIYVGRNVSIAHDALVHGPCYVGDNTFIGFKAVVHDSVVGRDCYIGIGAVVVGVEIPDGRAVPHGTIVDSADAVDKLPPATDAHHEFNHDVVEVNRGLAVAYHRAHESIHLHPLPTPSRSLRDRF